MTKVYIVILNFNGFSNTIACCESLLKNKLNDIELSIIIVDNASKDDSVRKINEFIQKKKNIFLIENGKNLGFTGGCNEGARFALKSGADYVVFLNNDTRVDESLLTSLVNAADTAGVGAVVPKIYFERGFEFHKSRYSQKDLGSVIWYAGGKMDWDNLIGENVGVDHVDHGQFDEAHEADLATGCCLLVKAEVLKKIGLFDNRYFLYYEDADLSQKIKKQGLKIWYEPKAVLWHKNADSSGGSGSDLQDYYISRNRMLFGMSYAPVRTKIALAREGLNLLRSGRKWQRAGVRDYFLRKFGRGSYNI